MQARQKRREKNIMPYGLKALFRVLIVAIMLLPARPAFAEGAAVAAFSAAAKVLLVAVPVAAVGYIIYKGLGGDKKDEKPAEKKEGPAEKPAEKPAAEPAKAGG